MGCPDWPKCFGSWVPPTSEAQLPADYRERFAAIRVNKNQRLVNYLEFFGFDTLATTLQSESIAAPEATFNIYKTWTEYVNRLLGVILGLLITAMAATSVILKKNLPRLFYGSLAAFVLVVFQGWIGSLVVSSNLLPGMITFHMMLAVLLIGILIYLYYASKGDGFKSIPVPASIRIILSVTIAMFLLQIVVGTQVREEVDIAALAFSKASWIEQLGGAYIFHRSFSILLLAVTGYLVVYIRRLGYPGVKTLADLLFILVVIEALLGIVMAYFRFPAWAQPLHLMGALMIVGFQFWMFLKMKKKARA